MPIDDYSLAAIPLEMTFHGNSLAKGTGFVWRTNRQAFLITNWHNVTGKNPNIGQHLSPHAGEPDAMTVQFDLAGSPLGQRGPVELSLRDPAGDPLWRQHAMAPGVDVVAVPLPKLAGAVLHPINEMPNNSGTVPIGIEAFILGYPFGIGVSTLPIWKRASVASEPSAKISGKPCFYVDTASRPGMSGSPVILRHRMAIGPPTTFIGVYSGRIGREDELQAQLGIVWRAEVIDQIITAGRPGSMTIL
jgi:hypothetical protein